MFSLLERIGDRVLGAVEEVGQMATLLFDALVWAFRPPYRIRLFISQLYFVGVGSLFIVMLTGLFAGAVFALQSAYAFSLFGAEGLVGSTVALALTRELAPVFSGLMVAGRTGSAMATELGTMRVTEQVDALSTMAVNPVQYLVTPRLLAAILMLPLLTLLFEAVGIAACYVISVKLLGIDAGTFWGKMRWYVDPDDIYVGLFKAAIFGMILGLVGCYKGFAAHGGAKGVGMATTQAVVVSSIGILVADYFITLALFS